MIQDGIRFFAEEGKLIFRKSDNFIMGEEICMGSQDSIDNYEERVPTEEELQQYQELISQNNILENNVDNVFEDDDI